LDLLNKIIEDPPRNPFLPKCRKRIPPKVENEITERGNFITETTSESTSERCICKGATERPLFSSPFWQNLSVKEQNVLLKYEKLSHNSLEDAFAYTFERIEKGANIENPIGYIVDLLKYNRDLTGDSEAWAEYGRDKYYS
jgi:hypothetical protein